MTAKYYTASLAKQHWKEGIPWACYRNDQSHDGTFCKASIPSFNMPEDTHYYVLDTPEDEVNKPNHYIITVKGVEIDCRDVQKALGMYQHHCLASAFKYVWRALHKGATEKDIKKAINFLNEELAIREKESK